MKIAILAGALAIAAAAPAAADVVVWEESGANDAFSYTGALWYDVAPGRYRLEFISSKAFDYTFGYVYDVHYHVYGPEGYIFGNSYQVSNTADYFGNSNSIEFDIPAPFTEGTADDYQENHIENLGPILYSWAWEEEPFNYTVKLTLLSPVPEPASWAMMIAGFGLAGTTMRRHRANASLATT